MPDVPEIDLAAELAEFDGHTMHIKTRDPHIQGIIASASRTLAALGQMAARVHSAEYMERMARRHAMGVDAKHASAVAAAARYEAELAMVRAWQLRHEADCHAEPDTEVADLRRRVGELERENDRLRTGTDRADAV